MYITNFYLVSDNVLIGKRNFVLNRHMHSPIYNTLNKIRYLGIYIEGKGLS